MPDDDAICPGCSQDCESKRKLGQHLRFNATCKAAAKGAKGSAREKFNKIRGARTAEPGSADDGVAVAAGTEPVVLLKQLRDAAQARADKDLATVKKLNKAIEVLEGDDE